LRASTAQPGTTAIPSYDIAAGTNFPITDLGFAVNDIATWQFALRGYTGGNTITILIDWYAAATSGNVQWDIAVAVPTTASVLTKALGTHVATQTTVAGTTNVKNRTTITLSTSGQLDSAAADDMIFLQLKRIAASSSEMTGDALFIQASCKW
jgi:hypothetical protein